MATPVRIVGWGVALPPELRDMPAVAREEGIDPAVVAPLGVRNVGACAPGQGGSELARAACEEAMQRAGVGPNDLSVIVDFSVMPQEFLVPAWSMSNRLQGELNAGSAFTIGFSGGATSALILALRFACAHLRTDGRAKAALLVGADVALPGGRVVPREAPAMVLGDGAAALVLMADRGGGGDAEAGAEVECCALRSVGAMHDCWYIPGGAMTHPDRADLYRVVFDDRRFAEARPYAALRAVVAEVLDRVDAPLGKLASVVFPAFSPVDMAACSRELGIDAKRAGDAGRSERGFLPACELALGLFAALGTAERGARVLLASHGMGTLHGAALVRS